MNQLGTQFWALGALLFILNFSHSLSTLNYISSGVCDRTFYSLTVNSSHGTANGTFEGPVFQFQSTDENGTSVARAHHCIYKFIAGPNERAQISFTKFSLRSSAPECFNEYVDIYYEMKDPDSDLLNTPFGGRYCDLAIPHDRISLYQTIVISYYTDWNETDGASIFSGDYSFINATPYTVGTVIPNQICSFAIYSDQKREGEFMSPTYPGVYPKDMNCYYLFSGQKGQRVKLEFMDFDLYFGGPHCPFDYIKIFDGDSDQAPLINTYCGQQRQLIVFSSGTSLFVQFTTLKRISDSQNRGFTGFYEFSEKFVNLGFILNNENSEHILGTECDQKILSRKESNGTIYAPNYPFLYHSNIMCKYFIYGLQDAQNLERINFQFEMLQIPTKDVNECTDAYVRLYTQTQAMDEFDYVFCGETIPPPVVSDGPILLVVFNSGSTQGQGFKAHYWFETDYKITGTQASPGQCHFSYLSQSGKQGEFNSPRHPSNYPSNTYCVYEFFGEPDEQVKLVFNHFRFSDSEVEELGISGYNQVCNHDWLEIYTVDPSGVEIFYGRFCSSTAPGPIITEQGINQVKVVTNTDDTDVSSGFIAHYQFIRPSEIEHNCGGNFTNLENGIITTPNYPGTYPAVRQVCNWFITVKPGNRILLHFEKFSVEGHQTERGCSGAVIRVWRHDRPVELCGFHLSNDSTEYISDSNVLRVTFIAAEKSIGAEGFMATWTELNVFDEMDTGRRVITRYNGSTHSHCNSQPGELYPFDTSQVAPGTSRKPAPPVYYQCGHNGYCISAKLRCNGIQNCGFGDRSDEENCIQEARINLLELVGGLAGLSMFVFFTIGGICLTAILIGNWLRRGSNEEKVVAGSFQDKNCQLHFQPSVACPSEYPGYYQGEMSTIGGPGLGTSRVVEVMTVSKKWPPVNSIESHSTSGANPASSEHGFMEMDMIPPTGDPIPPPPPPPSASTRNLLSTSRQSSLANFYGENFIDVGSPSGARSTMSIDRSYVTTFSAYRAGRARLSSTLSRTPQQQQQQPYPENRPTTSTFGYPTGYQTLSSGNTFTRYNAGNVCHPRRGKNSPTNSKNEAELDEMEGNGGDDDTDVSVQMGKHNGGVLIMDEQNRHRNDSAQECCDVVNQSLDTGHFDDDDDDDDEFTEPTSLQKYQMNKMMLGGEAGKSNRWPNEFIDNSDSMILDDPI